MSNYEPFKMVYEQIEGVARHFHAVICAECGKVGRERARSRGADPELVSRKFRREGWRIGKRRRDDTCPACVKLENAPKPKVQQPPDDVPAYGHSPYVQFLIAEAMGMTTTEPSPKKEPSMTKRAPNSRPTRHYDVVRSMTGHPAIKFASRAAREALKDAGHPDPKGRGHDYVTFAEAGGTFGWRHGPKPTWLKANDETDTPTQPDINEDSMNDTAQDRDQAIAAVPPRQPTPHDRRRMQDEIEAHWTHQDVCYVASWGDQDIAKTLNIPRAWVTDIRTGWFGERDTNQAAKVAEKMRADALSDINISALEANVESILNLAVQAQAFVDAMRAEAKRIGL